MKCKAPMVGPLSTWLPASTSQRLWTTLWATLVLLWWAATHPRYICMSTGLCACPGPVLRPAPRPEPWCQAYNRKLVREVAENDAAEVGAPLLRAMPLCVGDLDPCRWCPYLHLSACMHARLPCINMCDLCLLATGSYNGISEQHQDWNPTRLLY